MTNRQRRPAALGGMAAPGVADFVAHREVISARRRRERDARCEALRARIRAAIADVPVEEFLSSVLDTH